MKPLTSCVIAIAGKFGSWKHKDIETIVINHGGTVSKEVVRRTTHLICSENARESAVKAQQARELGIPFIRLKLIVALDRGAVAVDIHDFLFDNPKPDQKPSSGPVHRSDKIVRSGTRTATKKERAYLEVPIDDECLSSQKYISSKAHVYYDRQNQVPYDIWLTKVESTENMNRFYRIQVRLR
jgi:hypothetical protein